MMQQPPPRSEPSRWSSALFDWDSGRLSLAIIASAALLTLCELRVLALIRTDNINAIIAESVVNHHAYWRAFQNRLMGPQLVDWVAAARGIEYDRAYLHVTQWLVALANLI